jgi:photosystem II stability/assembly factor-like uncharacterized protein
MKKLLKNIKIFLLQIKIDSKFNDIILAHKQSVLYLIRHRNAILEQQSAKEEYEKLKEELEVLKNGS